MALDFPSPPDGDDTNRAQESCNTSFPQAWKGRWGNWVKDASPGPCTSMWPSHIDVQLRALCRSTSLRIVRNSVGERMCKSARLKANLLARARPHPYPGTRTFHWDSAHSGRAALSLCLRPQAWRSVLSQRRSVLESLRIRLLGRSSCHPRHRRFAAAVSSPAPCLTLGTSATLQPPCNSHVAFSHACSVLEAGSTLARAPSSLRRWHKLASAVTLKLRRVSTPYCFSFPLL